MGIIPKTLCNILNEHFTEKRSCYKKTSAVALIKYHGSCLTGPTPSRVGRGRDIKQPLLEDYPHPLNPNNLQPSTNLCTSFFRDFS
ncbi:hypothetical protein Hdeb2414_s0001g00008141 [Helianthus debilis subsp. tardiflorus]